MDEYIVLPVQEFRSLVNNKKMNESPVNSEHDDETNDANVALPGVNISSANKVTSQSPTPSPATSPAVKKRKATAGLPLMDRDDVSKTLKNNEEALKLFDYLERMKPDIDWNNNNEVLLSGIILPNSNVYTLLKDATNKKGKIESDLAVFNVFKNWLNSNKIPENLVNAKVLEKKRQHPKITQPISVENFPSISELKERSPNKGVEIHNDKEAANSTIVNNEIFPDPKSLKRTVTGDINVEPVRKSGRKKRSPQKYGFGRKRVIKKIRWIRY